MNNTRNSLFSEEILPLNVSKPVNVSKSVAYMICDLAIG